MLTPKQRAFVTEYVLDKNATQAAIRAGYSPATASSQGFELLKKPEIQAGIEAKLADTAARNESTFDRWISRLWEEADDFSEMSSHSARVGALKEIGKALGYYDLHNRQKAPVVTQINLVPPQKIFEAAGKSIVKPNPAAATYGPDDDDDY